MLGNSFGIVFQIVCEIEPAIRRQLIEGIDLSFARLQRVADVFLWKIIKLYIGRLQLRDRQIVKFRVVQFACIFTIQPMEFVGIESRRATPDVSEFENPDDLVDIDFLAVVLGRPAKQTQIVAHSCREIAAPDVVLHARAFVAFAHLRSVAV